jgi:hypothetical protein
MLALRIIRIFAAKALPLFCELSRYAMLRLFFGPDRKCSALCPEVPQFAVLVGSWQKLRLHSFDEWSAAPSDIRPLIRMPTQIPAWQPSLMRKQRFHASPGLRWIEGQRRLSALLQYGGVVIHNHRTVGVPAGRSPDPKNRIVQAIRESRNPKHRNDRTDENAFQPLLQDCSGGLSHDARL